MPTIVEFLEARIVENERAVSVASEYGVTKMFGSMSATAIVIHEDGTRLWTTDQLLAECAAKRAIIAAFDPKAPDLDPFVGVSVIAMLASAYKDHPDYQQEWAL